jgi:hypothetical protein
MPVQHESTFEKGAPELFEKLETEMKALKDAEYSAAVIDKGITEAKSLLESGKTAEAEQKYTETKILLEEAEASNQAEPLIWMLFRVELLYLFLLLLVGYLTYQWPTYWLWSKFRTVHAGVAWFGALGGVTVGLFGLYRHLQARDFDPKFRLWYTCKPIMGAVFGWFVFMVFYVGLIAVQGQTDRANPLLFYVIAFLAGFSERFTVKIVDHIMQVLMSWEETPKSTGTPSVLPQV